MTATTTVAGHTIDITDADAATIVNAMAQVVANVATARNIEVTRDVTVQIMGEIVSRMNDHDREMAMAAMVQFGAQHVNA